MSVAFVVRLAAWGWFLAAVAAAHFRLLAGITPFALGALVLGLAATLVYAYLRLGAFRAWVDALDLRALILLHLARFTGVWLLVLHQRGELPRAYALPAGASDLVVAAFALPLAFAPLADAVRHRLLRIWCIVGLVGLLLALAAYVQIAFQTPWQLRPLAFLPLSLLPTVVMPLALASHVILLLRLPAASRAA
jgi:hypothetical protein